ncbi:MAG: 50S ribosomal protein L29 [Candidatus Babeliales bacterium]
MKEKINFKELSEQELREKYETLKREHFSLTLNAATAHIKDYSQFNKLRKDIARTLTFLNQKLMQ